MPTPIPPLPLAALARLAARWGLPSPGCPPGEEARPSARPAGAPATPSPVRPVPPPGEAPSPALPRDSCTIGPEAAPHTPRAAVTYAPTDRAPRTPAAPAAEPPAAPLTHPADAFAPERGAWVVVRDLHRRPRKLRARRDDTEGHLDEDAPRGRKHRRRPRRYRGAERWRTRRRRPTGLAPVL
ncbi:MAG TPA: hypothetical protein VF263_23595 [Longimicrobiaceae bacterium]